MDDLIRLYQQEAIGNFERQLLTPFLPFRHELQEALNLVG